MSVIACLISNLLWTVSATSSLTSNLNVPNTPARPLKRLNLDVNWGIVPAVNVNESLVNPVAINEGNPKIICLISNLLVRSLVIAWWRPTNTVNVSDTACLIMNWLVNVLTGTVVVIRNLLVNVEVAWPITLNMNALRVPDNVNVLVNDVSR